MATMSGALKIASKWGVGFEMSKDDGALVTPRMVRTDADALAAALTDAGFEASAAAGQIDGRDGDESGYGWVYLTEPDESADTAHGYTFAEWLAEAGRKDSASEYDLRAAWRAGEDPSEYA